MNRIKGCKQDSPALDLISEANVFLPEDLTMCEPKKTFHMDKTEIMPNYSQLAGVYQHLAINWTPSTG
jgi:hypothetical protein